MKLKAPIGGGKWVIESFFQLICLNCWFIQEQDRWIVESSSRIDRWISDSPDLFKKRIFLFSDDVLLCIFWRCTTVFCGFVCNYFHWQKQMQSKNLTILCQKYYSDILLRNFIHIYNHANLGKPDFCLVFAKWVSYSIM